MSDAIVVPIFSSLLQTDADKGNKVQLYSAVNEGRVRIMNNESGKKNVNVVSTIIISSCCNFNSWHISSTINSLMLISINQKYATKSGKAVS